MIEELSPEDNAQENTDHHMNTWRIIEQPMDSTEDRDFTQNELRVTIERLSPRKAPGQDWITREFLMRVFKSIPKNVTSIYNEFLKTDGSQENGRWPK